MPGETATHKVPYALGADKPPSVPTITKSMAERIETLLSKGGDVTIAADGTVTIGEGKVTDAKLANPNNSAYRPLLFGSTVLATDALAATYIISNSVSTNPSGANNEASPSFFYFDDADFTVEGKTQKLRLRAQVAVNATKPTMKFTVGLYPITVAGGADELKITLGTVVAGSTVAINEPAASTITQGNSGDFTIPADGAYAFGVVTNETLTNNSKVLLSAQLQSKSV